jgi:predicted RNase H-like nuclease
MKVIEKLKEVALVLCVLEVERKAIVRDELYENAAENASEIKKFQLKYYDIIEELREAQTLLKNIEDLTDIRRLDSVEALTGKEIRLVIEKIEAEKKLDELNNQIREL